MTRLAFTLEELKQLEQLVIQECDRTLLPFLSHTNANVKADGSIVTQADLAMQQAIKTLLQTRYGDHIAFLGEESSLKEQQHIVNKQQQFWVVDPLDGTTNFHLEFPIFCVSLAFISEGTIQMGITYDPIRRECFSALKDFGFYFQQQLSPLKPHQKQLSDCIAFIDFKRLSHQQSFALIEAMPFRSQRNIGSSALEWAWLAAGRGDLSFHGGQKLWDYAAGSLMLEEAGGVSQDPNGQPLYQQDITVRPIAAASSIKLAADWRQLLQQLD